MAGQAAAPGLGAAEALALEQADCQHTERDGGVTRLRPVLPQPLSVKATGGDGPVKPAPTTGAPAAGVLQ